MIPRLLPLGMVCAAVALGATVDRPGADASAPPPQAVAVISQTKVCPDVRRVGERLTTRVSVGAPRPAATDPAATDPGATDPAATDTAARGSLLVQPLTSAEAPVRLPVDRPGQVATSLGRDVDGDVLVVTATGSLAPGLELEQLTRGESSSTRGYAGQRCAAARSESWFVGGSTMVGDASQLLLVNPDAADAVVDVAVFTSQGPAEARAGRGVPVPARSRITIPLDTLAPDRALLAVHVRAQRGRVASALRHARFDGRVPRGAEWVPESGPPAGQVVVGGLPAGPGRRSVLVTNPGEDDTTVTIELVTRSGTTPVAGALRVPAGTSVSSEVTALLASSAATAIVRSDGGPVLAAGFVYDGQRGPVREFAYAGASEPLQGPALVTGVVLNRRTESTLVLSALLGAAEVSVAPVPVVGVDAPLPPARTVRVAAGRTVTLPLSTLLTAPRSRTTARPARTAATRRAATGAAATRTAAPPMAVEVRPLTGAIWVARHLREQGAKGPLVTIAQLEGATGPVDRPAVVRDPALAVRPPS